MLPAGRAFEVVHVCLGDDEFRGRLDLLLVLNVQLNHLDGLGCVDFVLRQELCRRKFEDVEAAGDF